MKFQNPSFKFFLNGQTNKQTDGRTSRKQYAPHFFKVGGIKRCQPIKAANDQGMIPRSRLILFPYYVI